jgi:cytochrome c oxidase subunit 2
MGRHKKKSAGSTSVAFALALFLVVFTAITVYLFIAKPWWFPPAITDVGKLIDSQFSRTLVITGVVFVLAQIGLAWVVFRYRSTGERASHS